MRRRSERAHEPMPPRERASPAAREPHPALRSSPDARDPRARAVGDGPTRTTAGALVAPSTTSGAPPETRLTALRGARVAPPPRARSRSGRRAASPPQRRAASPRRARRRYPAVGRRDQHRRRRVTRCRCRPARAIARAHAPRRRWPHHRSFGVPLGTTSPGRAVAGRTELIGGAREPDPIDAAWDARRARAFVWLWVSLALLTVGIGAGWILARRASASSCSPPPSSAPMRARSRPPTRPTWPRATPTPARCASSRTGAQLRRHGRARRRAAARRSGRGHRRRRLGHAQARRARAEAQPERRSARRSRAAAGARALALERGEACTDTNPAEDGDIAARCALQKGDVDSARKILAADASASTAKARTCARSWRWARSSSAPAISTRRRPPTARSSRSIRSIRARSSGACWWRSSATRRRRRAAHRGASVRRPRAGSTSPPG